MDGSPLQPPVSAGAEPQDETIELLRACNDSLHSLCAQVWKALEPSGEYEGNLSLAKFAESIRVERDELLAAQSLPAQTVNQEMLAALRELKESRTAWHESFGVPVSAEHARFMQTIGHVQDLLTGSIIPMVLRGTGRIIPDLRGREHVCEYQSSVKAESAIARAESEPREPEPRREEGK